MRQASSGTSMKDVNVRISDYLVPLSRGHGGRCREGRGVRR